MDPSSPYRSRRDVARHPLCCATAAAAPGATPLGTAALGVPPGNAAGRIERWSPGYGANSLDIA